MTQVGEGVFVAVGGPEKCIYCEQTHQDNKASTDDSPIPRDMTPLKKGGRGTPKYVGDYEDRADRFLEDFAPILDWSGSSNLNMDLGFKGAAHHCLPLSIVNKSKLLGEFKAAEYNPNRGENNLWLPYSKLQFSRARAIHEVVSNASSEEPPKKKKKSNKKVAVSTKDSNKDLRLQKHRGGHTDTYFDYCARILDAQVKAGVESDFCLVEGEELTKEDLIEILTDIENLIWNGLTSKSIWDEFKLYNDSYLEPYVAWGSYEWEDKSPQDFLGYTAFIQEPEADSDEAAVESLPPTED